MMIKKINIVTIFNLWQFDLKDPRNVIHRHPLSLKLYIAFVLIFIVPLFCVYNERQNKLRIDWLRKQRLSITQMIIYLPYFSLKPFCFIDRLIKIKQKRKFTSYLIEFRSLNSLFYYTFCLAIRCRVNGMT